MAVSELCHESLKNNTTNYLLSFVLITKYLLSDCL